MDKPKYSWSGKATGEADSEVSGRVPTEASWGYYGCDDLVGNFLWFESWPELLEFIGEHEVNFGDLSNGQEKEETRADIRRIVVGLLARRLSVAEGLTQLNSALPGSSRIVWWGQASELLEGSGKCTEYVRERFRWNDPEDRDDPAVPINRAELGNFLGFLTGFSDRV